MAPKKFSSALHPLLTTMCALLSALPPTLSAQTAAPARVDAATLTKYDTNKNGVLDPVELAVKDADDARAGRGVASQPGAPADDVITLTPFEVSGGDDKGYAASNTLAGTRLNSRLEDIAGSISVVTKQQLIDTAALDINDIFLFEVGTEGTGQFTDLTNDGRGDYDNVAGNPTGANRMRGLSSANIAVGGFTASASIPIDTYNIDAVEIARGPNSNLAGLSDAGGTVNLITSKANLTREISNFQGRVDSYGGWRASLDLNRPLIKNKLAVRVSAVYNEQGFVRKPSVDRTNRQQIGLTYRPFAKTTINGTFERFSEYAQRANSITPRDSISLWKSRGSPTWDPITFTATVNGVRQAPAVNAAALPLGLSDGFGATRILQFIDNGRFEVITKAANPNNAALGLTSTQRMVSLSNEGVSGLYKISGSTDKNFYDWTAINLAASGYQIQNANIANVSIDQGLISSPRHRLDLNLAWRREDQTDYRRQFVGQLDGVGTTVTLDPNERLPDGRANPFFLRPFIGGVNPQTFKKPVFNDNYRWQAAYQLDLRKEKNLTKWLGLHRAIGYQEYRLNIEAPRNLRYHDTVTYNANYQPNVVNLPTNPNTNLSSNNGALFYPLFFMGNTRGGGVEYANTGPVNPNGNFLASFAGANSTAYNLNEPVEIQEVYFALGTQKKKVRTAGATIQSFWLNDSIITTFGERRDRVYTQDHLPTTLRGGFIDETNLWNFGTNKRWRRGETKTTGVVLRPFRALPVMERWEQGSTGVSRFLAQGARGLSLYYNKSDAFKPEDTSYNLYLAELPNPTGTSEEFGFGLSLFDNRFSMRLTHHETLQQATRAGTGVLATRALSIDFDNSGQNQNFGLYDLATGWYQAINPSLTLDQAQTRAAQLMGTTPAFIQSAAGKNIADVSNALSRGWELELQFNPTRYWTMKATGNQQEAIDSGVSVFIQQFVNERLPFWTTVRIPTDRLPDGSQLVGAGDLWWTGSNGTGVPVNYFNNNVQTPLNLAITTQGKKKPQTREYTFNLITNYQLAGIAGDNKWLRNMAVGGAYRWASKGAIGYLGAAPDPDGIVRTLDRNKPVFDKAQGNLDLNMSYRTRLFRDRVGTRFQLNIRNVNESGRLKGVAVNPDGRFWQYRIIDPRQFIFTTTFDL